MGTGSRAFAAVVVAVLTCRRVERIAALVPELLDQAAAAADMFAPAPAVRVLVVDNDAAGSAREAVAAAARTWAGAHGDGPRLDYVLEPVPGISAARNRALAQAADADAIVFIDDDERPAQGWLSQLLRTAQDHDADAVAGRVRTVYPEQVDPWIVAGGFLERGHRAGLATGAVLIGAATNNLLLDLRTVRSLGLAFDPSFGTSGGEDTLFTRQLTRAGARLVWCDEAVVDDIPEAGRMTRRWLLGRSLGYGANEPRIDAALAAGRPARLGVRLRHAAAGIARLGLGAWCWAVPQPGGERRQALGLRTLARGLGNLLGSIGYRRAAYGSRMLRRPG
jgi:glycosyltransferase involved in cell wall biosynthesis